MILILPNKKIISAQETIPYASMSSDGICHVREKLYTKTMSFDDISYRLADDKTQKDIFDCYSHFLNSFDDSISLQLTFISKPSNLKALKQKIRIVNSNAGFEYIQKEFSEMLEKQLEKANDGFQKQKFITVGIKANNKNDATTKLYRICSDISSQLNSFGVKAEPINGKTRLALFNSCFNNEYDESFNFSWELVNKTGYTTKDFIAPSVFDFREKNSFKSGNVCGSVSFVDITASELSDSFLSDLLELDMTLYINLHIKAVDRSEALRLVKRKITDIDKMKIDEQKKAVRSGYDMDILPSDINVFGVSAKNLLNDIEQNNQRLFMISFLIMNIAPNMRKLNSNIRSVKIVIQKHNCILKPLDFEQEQGLMASIPIGIFDSDIKRTITTNGAAILIPFNIREAFNSGKDCLYYGLNAITNNLIYADRKSLKNPNGLILGTPGSGKSFSAKREISNAYIATDDDIVICDPEAEYCSLVSYIKGQVIKISQNSNCYINPFDISQKDTTENAVLLKTDFILSFCELVLGENEKLSASAKSIIDKAVRNIYVPYIENPIQSNIPVLEDLYNELLSINTDESKQITDGLEMYVHGSLNLFNHRTNIDVSNRLVCFDIKDIGKQLKKAGMLVIQDFVWNRLSENRDNNKSTRYYIDEFHLLLADEQTALYSVEMWKRFRKWGGIPTGITQNVKSLLASREIETIFENSDFIYMLSQASGDRKILKKHLNISERQLKYVTNSKEGEGLIFFGDSILPFVDNFPKNTTLYKYMTTKPSEVNAFE